MHGKYTTYSSEVWNEPCRETYVLVNSDTNHHIKCDPTTYPINIFYCYHICLADHKRLYEDLHEVAPKWQTFGVHLKVPFDRLEGFQGEGSMVERCFTEVLVAWLRGVGTSCTVEQLVSALEKPGVDQKRLAKEIERNKSGELLYRRREWSKSSF